MFHFGSRKAVQPLDGERRQVSRRIYAFGVLNTVTDVLFDLLPVLPESDINLFGISTARQAASLECGERNVLTCDLHVLVPLVVAPRIGGVAW